MSRRTITAGATGVSVTVFVQDTSSPTGDGLAGLLYNTAGLTARYRRAGQSNWTTITLAPMTLGTWVSGGFIAAGLDGKYELGLPNAAVAAGAGWVDIEIFGADDMLSVLSEIELEAASSDGVVSGFTDDALEQLRSANVGLSQWDPETEPAKIYRGMDHLHATGNDFVFTNPEGTWPDLTGCTVRMELRVAGVTAVAGAGTIVTPSGEDQEVYVQVLRTAFDASSIKDGTGTFRVVRIDAEGNRFPLANGIATLYPNTAPAV